MSEKICFEMSTPEQVVVCKEGIPHTQPDTAMAYGKPCAAWQNGRCALVPECNPVIVDDTPAKYTEQAMRSAVTWRDRALRAKAGWRNAIEMPKGVISQGDDETYYGMETWE